jgi:hypothetical protein
MTIDLFTEELARKLGRMTLDTGNAYLAPVFSLGKDANQPAMAIAWETAGPDDCRLMVSPQLIESGRIPYAADRLSGVWPMMEAFYVHARRAGAPTGRVHINVDDNPVLPGLAFCANDDTCSLIPDPYFMRRRGYADIRLSFATGGPPWQSRKSRAIWRGATTGDSTAGWRGLPRVKLCQLSRKHPDLLDAGLTSVVQQDPGAEAEIAQAGLMSTFIEVQDFADWAIQIDIDGNTNSWPGLFQKLLTGSPVVKVASPGRWRQWYYDKLEPWVNFVPVRSDLGDLIEKLTWLRDHPRQARAIGMEGRSLALSISYESALENAVQTINTALQA